MKIKIHSLILEQNRNYQLIDFIKDIPHKIVAKKLLQHGINSIADFNSLRVHDTTEVRHKLIEHVKQFWINAPIGETWDAYKEISPAKAWNGNIIQFSLMHNRNHQNVFVAQHPGLPTLEINQLHLLAIKLLFGRINLCVGYEVTEVNDQEKYFTTEYLKISKSMGYQTIKLESVSDKCTKITHYTKYLSGNWFRDRIIYPIFHSMTVSVLHNNVKAYLTANPSIK
jgi:hypothetical protein